VRFAARGSPFGEADVGVDDADQRQQRKVVALGDELRADDEVVVAARRASNCPRIRSMPPGVSEDNTSNARLGKQSLRLLRDALDPGAAGGKAVGLVAFGTDVGLGSLCPQ